MDNATALLEQAMTDEEVQYQLVYQGICAIAASCDGAVEADGVGFNGQHTKFGRRIAALPFEAWSADIREEAARIILTYNRQAMAATGVDFSKLSIVQTAQGWHKNPNAYIEARKADPMVEVKERKVRLVEDGIVAVGWSQRDGEFEALLTAMRACPGRVYDASTRCWVAPLTRDLASFLHTYEFPLKGRLSSQCKALLAAPVKITYNVNLDAEPGRATIRAPYDTGRVAATRYLPGRRWDAARRLDAVNLCPELLAFAATWGLAVHPDVELAISQGPQPVVDPLPALLRAASACARPEDLPEEFIALLG